jgi:transposase
MVVETSRPIADVAREFGINETSLGNWVRACRQEHAGDEPPLQLSERARLRELERENRGESPCWPGLVSRATGRQRRSAARWILVVSPPRERPIASRPVFLSFAEAPRAVISGKDAAGPGRVLVRAVDRGVGADCPVLALGLITAGPQPVQDLLPGAIQ